MTRKHDKQPKVLTREQALNAIRAVQPDHVAGTPVKSGVLNKAWLRWCEEHRGVPGLVERCNYNRFYRDAVLTGVHAPRILKPQNENGTAEQLPIEPKPASDIDEMDEGAHQRINRLNLTVQSLIQRLSKVEPAWLSNELDKMQGNIDNMNKELDEALGRVSELESTLRFVMRNNL